VEKIHAEEAAVGPGGFITMETPQIVGACNVHPLAGREAVVGNNNGKRQIYERGQRCNDRGKAPASWGAEKGEIFMRDETHGVRSGQSGRGADSV